MLTGVSGAMNRGVNVSAGVTSGVLNGKMAIVPVVLGDKSLPEFTKAL